MDYRCPNCGEDLQYKLIPTKPTNDRAFLGLNIFRTPSCKNCGVLIEIANNKEDFKLMRFILAPLVIGIISAILNQTWLLYVSGITFIAGIIYVTNHIRKASYQNKPYFKLYEKKP